MYLHQASIARRGDRRKPVIRRRHGRVLCENAAFALNTSRVAVHEPHLETVHPSWVLDGGHERPVVVKAAIAEGGGAAARLTVTR